MDVKIKVSIGDSQPGSVITLVDAEAKSLIRMGLAELPIKPAKKGALKPKAEEVALSAEIVGEEPTINSNEDEGKES